MDYLSTLKSLTPELLIGRRNPSLEVTREPNGRLFWSDNYFEPPKAWLEIASFQLKEYAGEAASTSQGFADRYGGAGIGRNGGAGRSIMLNGFYLKGVGRTPLLGSSTDISHSSGLCFLGEALRELIWSKIVQQCFPFGGVSILAIVDIGKYCGNIPNNNENTCVVVREPILRPAHFDRAYFFCELDLSNGVQDELRVSENVARLFKELTAAGAWQWLLQWSGQWATQVGFSFAHRFSIGGVTTSNVDCFGGVVDYGGMISLPSWGKFERVPGEPVFGEELTALLSGVFSIYLQFARHGCGMFTSHLPWKNVEQNVRFTYMQAVYSEILWLAGLARETVIQLLNSTAGQGVVSAIDAVINHQQTLRHCLLCGDVEIKGAGGLDGLWSTNEGQYAALRNTLRESFGEKNCAVLEELSQQRSFRRIMLESRALHSTIDDALRSIEASKEDSQAFVDELIATTLSRVKTFSRDDHGFRSGA